MNDACRDQAVALTKAISAQSTALQAEAASDVAFMQVPGVGRTDEIDEMAGAVQVFKDNAVEKRRLEGEAAEQRRQAEADRALAEAQRADAARDQAEVVQSLAKGLSRLASGDLVHQLDQSFPADYEQLRDDFNKAKDMLLDTMRDVVGAARST